ncbi:MAG: zf-HC2 domain-containing protein [Gemmatimonadetes bacterium]|nr:zf-HC2 domain-containing protein [Gemmatimonadota bacterium]NNK61749.1 zf-HC2 domain-containing protein [Gemmatimonadota bacterium]
MNEIRCADIVDRLPVLAAGQVEAAEVDLMRQHLSECASCRDEWTVVELLHEAGPAPVPAGLEARLHAAVRDVAGQTVGSSVVGGAPGRKRWRVPSWGLAAAAGIVLAVATPVLVERMGDAPVPTIDDVEIEIALGERLPSPWLDDEEDVVAGAAVLDGLSDEALERLLEEMGG